MPTGTPRKKRDNAEHRIQVAIVTWFRGSARGFGVDPRLLFAIPNGALYGTGIERVIRAKMLKAEGVTPGVSDLFLAIPRSEYCGAFIEVKTPDGAIRPEQKAFLELVGSGGYHTSLVRSVEDGITAITNYLRLR